MRRIALLGGGGHASDLLGLIERLAETGLDVDVFIGDDSWERVERFDGRPATLCSIDEALASSDVFVGATGYPAARAALVDRALDIGASPSEPLCHPTAELSAGALIGRAAVVQGQSWLSPLVEVGAHSYIGYGAKIGHDSVVGECCSVMPGCFIGGDVALGDRVLVGAGAIVLQGLSIGEGAVVGAGATVLEDVPAGATVVGSPARGSQS